MNMTGTTSNSVAAGANRLRIWAPIVATFSAATASQVAFYAAPFVFGFGAYHLPNVVYTPALLAWLFVPASVAMLFGLRRLAKFSRASSTKMPASSIVAIVAFGLLSAYIGVFIAFN